MKARQEGRVYLPSFHLEKWIEDMGGLLASLSICPSTFPSLPTTRKHTQMLMLAVGLKQTWQPGCFPALWCRFPSSAWLALQSELSVVTTV